MTDFYQAGTITTLHDLGTARRDRLEALLDKAAVQRKLGLVLPVTAGDMRAEPFANIIRQLAEVNYIDTFVIALGLAPDVEDYRQAKQIISTLGDRAEILWTDGERVQELYRVLIESDFNVALPGKGRAAWTAFGYLLADPTLSAFVLHDCDIVDYDRVMLARLCLPMAHESLDFEFCKAYYARVAGRMHGRVVRLLVTPLLRSLILVLGNDPFLEYLSSFRYPLSGEFAVTANLARSNRIPSDWGLEVGTLAEVFRNTSVKRICQVDLCIAYEHKHQSLSLKDTNKGLMQMATDILTSIFRTLASRGTMLDEGLFRSLRSTYLRNAQDAIRQYHADALVNSLMYDRHGEEQAVEGFAHQIEVAGKMFCEDPAGAAAIPNWVRVLTAFPDFPRRLREAARADAKEFA